MGWTYDDAGVSIAAGDALVDRIKPLAARTRIPEVLDGLGGFAGLCRVPEGLTDPILVSGTDGVGTKLRVAFAADRHDTVGIDLVAMCVNDILTTGARPLFFLDYFATGRLDVDKAEAVLRGIARGCEEAGCALLGGETAEMPDSYPPGEYDLAGFAVGVVERARIWGPERVTPGDRLLGLPSSGLHSNGFSLVRKVLLEGDDPLPLDGPFGDGTLADALLTPTRIYAPGLAAVRALDGAVHAASHITGGGLPGNLPRVLPAGTRAQVRPGAIPAPAIFDLVAERGDVAPEEMAKTFNLGVGMVLVVDAAREAEVREALEAVGETPLDLGEVHAA